MTVGGARRGGGGRAWIAAGAAAALLACSPASASSRERTGAVMTTSEGVTLRKLGDVRPQTTYTGTTRSDFVDRAPIVLWAGVRPAAVLFLSVESHWRRAVQRIAPVDPAAKLPSLPVEYRSEIPEDGRPDEADGLDTRAVLSADLDGDGVEELVLLRSQGGIDVHHVRRGHLSAFPSPAAPRGRAYRREVAHVLRLKGRDVVYVLSARKGEGVDDWNLLLRVDANGITRVRLEGLERKEIRALGAIQRKGSQDVDELLVLVPDGREDLALARYRPDGKGIGEARRLYVRPPTSYAAFHFVPESSSAVLEVEGGALVVTPEKPANWIRELKMPEKASSDESDVLYVADLDGDPKLVHRVKHGLFAVNRDGQCFTPAGARGWTALPKAGPYLTLPVASDETIWFVWKVRDGRLLAGSSRERGTRPMTHDEWRRAADQYLPAAEAKAFRDKLEPSLEGEDYLRDSEMKDERRRRHVEPEQVRTVADWQRLLPDSYARVAKYNAKDHDVEVESRLRKLGSDPSLARDVPDPAGLRAFVAGLDVPARMTFMLVDGASVSSASVPGSPMRLLETQLGGPVEYRVHDGKLTAIMALAGVDAAGKLPPAFYEIKAPLTARR